MLTTAFKKTSVVFAVTLAAWFSAPNEASAQTIIKNPGQHPMGPELEPHLTLRPFDTPDDNFLIGAGFRATIQIGKNNFVPSINNSVGVGFGLDWLPFSGCGKYDCGTTHYFMIPVVMQWSFYLTKRWSVFAEPGVGFSFYGSDSCDNNAFGYRCHRENHFRPFVFYAGGRFHITESISLTMRLGWPYFSIGASFFLG